MTSLRFTDDVILVASNQRDVRRMAAHLATEAEKLDLKIHAGKTKILTNVTAQTRPDQTNYWHAQVMNKCLQARRPSDT